MRLQKLVSVAVVLVAASFGFPGYAASKGVPAVDAAWMKATKAGDVDAATKCYAADAVAWFPGGPMAKGTQQIHDAYKDWFSSTVIQDVKMTQLGVKTVGDESVGWGTYTVTSAPNAGGASTTQSGRYTEVAKKIDGNWVYVVDHASDDPAPAAGEKK